MSPQANPTSLAASLQPLLSLEGLVAVVLMTPDGLPVEMLGGGLRADAAAAELASLGQGAQAAARALGLGTLKTLTVELAQHELILFAVEDHFLGVIFQAQRNRSLVLAVLESVRPQVAERLRRAA